MHALGEIGGGVRAIRVDPHIGHNVALEGHVDCWNHIVNGHFELRGKFKLGFYTSEKCSGSQILEILHKDIIKVVSGDVI